MCLPKLLKQHKSEMRTQVMVLFAKRCPGFFVFELAEDVVSWIFPRDSVQVPSGLTGTKFHPAK